MASWRRPSCPHLRRCTSITRYFEYSGLRWPFAGRKIVFGRYCVDRKVTDSISKKHPDCDTDVSAPGVRPNLAPSEGFGRSLGTDFHPTRRSLRSDRAQLEQQPALGQNHRIRFRFPAIRLAPLTSMIGSHCLRRVDLWSAVISSASRRFDKGLWESAPAHPVTKGGNCARTSAKLPASNGRPSVGDSAQEALQASGFIPLRLHKSGTGGLFGADLVFRRPTATATGHAPAERLDGASFSVT